MSLLYNQHGLIVFARKPKIYEKRKDDLIAIGILSYTKFKGRYNCLVCRVHL